ncbi:MAG: hypothetical protein K2V38_13160, partial [Gemmataceae bacterium]|nr:hypothetical protein [Gemmataceae bacterium]
PPNPFPEPLDSQVELKKVRKKLKLVITGPLTPELVDEIKKQFPVPGPVEELLRKAMEEKPADNSDDDGTAE